jgi:hypothetical protein
MMKLKQMTRVACPPELKTNNEFTADDSRVCPAFANTLVVCSPSTRQSHFVIFVF